MQPAPTLPSKKKMDFSRGFTKEFNDEINRKKAEMYDVYDGNPPSSIVGGEKRGPPRVVKNDENAAPATIGQYKVEKPNSGQQSGPRGGFANAQHSSNNNAWSADKNTSSSSYAVSAQHRTANPPSTSSKYAPFSARYEPRGAVVDAFGEEITAGKSSPCISSNGQSHSSQAPSHPSGRQVSNPHIHAARFSNSRLESNAMDFSRGSTEEEEEAFQQFRAHVFGDDNGEGQSQEQEKSRGRRGFR